MNIKVIIANKRAVAVSHEPLVCGNSDYIIDFTFDEEWDAYDTKTARFIFDDQHYIDTVFSGNQCPVPVLKDISEVKVGVFAGDLKTTTPAYLRAQRSILCGTGAPVDPDPDVYNQIMQMIEDGKLRGEKGDPGAPGEKGDPGDVEVDATLSKAGMAADAAAVGEKVTALSDKIEVLDEKLSGTSGSASEVVILPETTVGISEMNGYLTTPCSELPKPGSTIAAIYNGVRYECKLGVMYSGDGDGLALGNLGAVEMAGGNNDAPFVIVFIPDGMDTDGDGNIDIYGIVMALDGSSEVTISLVKVADPAPGETFRVNVLVQEGEVVSCDSNIGEIKMAFDSGKMPYCVVDEHHGTKSIF